MPKAQTDRTFSSWISEISDTLGLEDERALRHCPCTHSTRRHTS